MLARSPSQAFAPMHDLLAAPPPADLASLLASLRQVEALLDAMPGVVFFVKDERARYVLVNRTLARRCGVKDKAELLGRSADEVFPSSLGPLYAEQDRRVLRGGATLENQLELHLYPGRQPGWCLTHKQALRDADGAIIGMAGISHDLPAAQSAHPAYGRLAAVGAYPRALRPAAQPRRSHRHRRALGGATGASLQAHLPAHPTADDPQGAARRRLATARRRRADHRDRPALRLHRPQRLQPPVQGAHRTLAEPIPRDPSPAPKSVTPRPARGRR
ncbi:putative transcriptional regulator [Pseudomonas aeruginosa PADK2_CF510]|nr:putative transcriptional regulator [Pseudomonas aeruginosa PADK2_CF510]